MRELNTVKWISLIVGVLLIIGGIIYIANPIETTMSLVQMISILLVIVGILRVIRYFTGTIFSTGSTLVGGILDILMGVVMIRNLSQSTIAFTILISFWVLTNGITQIAISIDFKKIGLSYWWFDLLSGILGLVFGFMLMGNFGLSAVYIAVMIGIYMMSLGIAFLVTFFGVSKFQKNNRY